MNILNRYLVREFSRIYGLCLVSFTFIFLIIDFIGKVDNFIEVDARLGDVVQYFVFKLPFLAVQMTPVATLIAIVVLFSVLRKNNEIIALKSVGISAYKCSIPLVATAIVLSGGVFLVSELLVPITSSKSVKIWNTVVRRSDESTNVVRNRIWQKNKNFVYYVHYFDASRNSMYQVSVYELDDLFHIAREVHAKLVLLKDGEWIGLDGIDLVRKDDGSYTMSTFKMKRMPIDQSPEAFLVPVKEPEEMTYAQLKRFAKRIISDGYDANEYLVDMYLKVAFPLINLIMVLWGVPIALGIPKGGASASVALGIGVCFAYIVFLGVMRSLGLTGLLPPWLAIWTPNIGFGLVGSYLMMRIPT